MTSAGPDVPFDLYGDLPEGRFAIEASAGTGKTFTLAALATRYLAAGDRWYPHPGNVENGELLEESRKRYY